MQPRHRLRIPLGLWLPISIALAFPLAWNAAFPGHRDQPVTVVLTPPHRDDVLDLPADRIQARATAGGPERGAPSLSFVFQLERGGRYSLYGISSHVTTAPLLMWIDGELVSNHAFDAHTGSRHRDFARQRLATGVALERGPHRVELAGSHLGVRTFVLELRREAPLGAGRYLALASLAGLLLVARGWLARRALTPPRRLAATAAFASLSLALLLLAVAHVAGGRLVTLNRGDLAKRERLARFESELRAFAERSSDAAFTVAVLGDSTHYWSLDPAQEMLPSIERALRPEEREHLRIFGVAAQAFSAFDYYLLLNHLVGTPTDLVVVPVALRSFGDDWLASAEHGFGDIERYLRFDEWIAAPEVRIGRRELGWERVLLWRLDHLLAGGRISLLLRGVRRHVGGELRLAAEQALPDQLLRPRPAREPSVWPTSIPEDHPLLPCFRAINRLAVRHGIQVLYYTAPSDRDAIAESGVRIDITELYAAIEREIARDPGVHWLDLADQSPRWMFSDRSDHLSERGVRRVAGRLAGRIGELAIGSGS